MTKHRNNKIEVMTDVAHVRAKMGMYVGSTDIQTHNRWTLHPEYNDWIQYRETSYVPAIVKLFDEIISNSIDEALRTNFEHANHIDVEIGTDNSITVTDNGRGISTDVDSEYGKTGVELAFTQLRAGSNFGDESFVSIGTHGLGASLVNILSSHFVAQSNDGKATIKIQSRWDESQKDLFTSVKKLKTGQRGTSVTFIPDFRLFGVDGLTDDIMCLIEKRVRDLALCFPDVRFRWQKKIVRTDTFKKYVGQIAESYEILETDKVKIAVIPSDERNHISFVNGIDVYEGGSHIDLVRQEIGSKIIEKLNKKHKKLNLRLSDVNNKVCFVVVTNEIVKPKFRSQTKEFITNAPKDFGDVFDGITEDRFINKILRNADLIDPIVETKKLRLEAQERVNLKKQARKIKKIRVPKHIPANGDASKAMLFITEGDSAAGMLTNVRDPDLHGCYPLRGKPLNTWGKKPAQILKNVELQQLMSVIGLEFGTAAEDLNYQHIKLLCDADYDGYAIASLLLAFFSNWPELFDQGRVSIVRCPILVATKGKSEQRFYSIDAYSEARKTGKVTSEHKLTYLKGLGSLTEDEYTRLIHNPVEDVVKLGTNYKSEFELAFGKDANARKLWLQS